MIQPNEPTYAVAAIVSTYNAEEFLTDRLENLTSQSLYATNGLAVIVVDSASEQDERRIVDSYMARHKHIVYLRTAERETVYNAWNRGIRLADARYVINANTDDRFAPQALEHLCSVLDNDPLVQAVYGDWLQTETPNDHFDSNSPKVRFEYPEFIAPLLFHAQITTHAAMLRREVFDLLGFFDDQLQVYGDREFMLRFAERGLVAKKLSEPVGLYYKNPNGLEHRNMDIGNAEFDRIMTDYLNPERFARLFGLEQVPDDPTLAGLYTLAGSRGNGFILCDDQPVSNLGTAGTLFARALEYDPHNPMALNNLGIISCCQGNSEQGIRLLEKSLAGAGVQDREIIQENIAGARQGSCLLGEYKWLASEPNDRGDDMANHAATPDRDYGRIQNLQDRDQMMAELQALVGRHLEFAPAHNDLGVLHYNAGDSARAMFHYEQAVRLQPDNITFKKNLADFYYVEQGRVEDALQLYVNVLEMHPQDVETLTICGHICVALQRFEDAGIFYRRVRDIEPGNTDVRDNLEKLQQSTPVTNQAQNAEQIHRQAQELADGEDLDGAVHLLKSMLDSNPDDALAHNDLGVLCYKKGDKQKALHHYEQAMHLQPENITFIKNLADFYYVEQDRVEDALQLYVNVLTVRPQDVETLIMCGHICVSQRRFEDAEVFYRRVLDIEPWNTDVRNNLEKMQESTLAAGSECSAEHLYQQAQELAGSGDTDGAMRLLESLLARDPDNSLAHNDLGVLCYKTGIFEKAVQHYEQAARLQPENIIFAKNLADFYYVEQGRIEDALRIYVQVLKLQPADIETLLITGRICDDLQNQDDARVFYQRVLELEPWNEDARQRMEQTDIIRKAV